MDNPKDFLGRIERAQVMIALSDWFASQEISQRCATYICAEFAGVCIGNMVDKREYVDQGVDILSRTMQATAQTAFTIAEDEK